MVGDPFGYGLLMPKQRNKLNKGTYFEYTEALKPKHSFTYEMWGKDQKGNPLFINKFKTKSFIYIKIRRTLIILITCKMESFTSNNK